MASLDGWEQSVHLRITLLGGFQVAVDGRVIPATEWRSARAATLVKVLALAPNHRLHRDQIMDMLWPDAAPDRAANSLYQSLHVARRVLGGPRSNETPFLRLTGEIVSLAPDSGVWIDVDA